MKIKLAKTIGFCMGVKRALFLTLSLARKREGKLYTWGPLIHSPQIIDVLAERGVEVLRELPPAIDGTVIIRAHGVAPAVRATLQKQARHVCDATCPDVMKVQSLVKKHSGQGYSIVIVGDRGHAEVEGLMGFAGECCFVINSMEEAKQLPPMERACVVAQTTQDICLYEEICNELKKHSPDCQVFQTICKSTRDKQKELRELAGSVDAIIVVGGRGSANTRRLADISHSCGVKTFHVESESDIDDEEISTFGKIGIVSGSSTPNWMIFRVLERLDEIGKRRTNPLLRWLKEVVYFAVKSNLYAAVGAGFMTYSASLIMAIPPSMILVIGSAFYVLSMHILNHFTDRKVLQFSEPAITIFYKQRSFLLITLGVGGICVVLAIGVSFGLLTLLFLSIACLLGIAYSIPIIPLWRGGKISLFKIRDIPASKDIFVPAAWTAVIVFLPVIAHSSVFNATVLVAAIYIFGVVFSRCLIFSMRDVQDDMIVGRETIPTLLGGERSRTLSLAVLLVLVVVLLGSLPLVGLLSLFLIFPLAYIFTGIYTYCYKAKQISHGLLFEVMLDTSFIIVGISALIWKVWSIGAAM